jgi:hypothetical protein
MENATDMAEVKALGFHFTFTKSKKKTSHFSTFKTMVEWVEFILQPYILEQIKILGLEADQKSILNLDVYSVHTVKAVLTYTSWWTPKSMGYHSVWVAAAMGKLSAKTDNYWEP